MSSSVLTFEMLDSKIDSKFDQLDSKIDERFSVLDSKINSKFGLLDAKIDGVLKTMNDRFEVVDEKFDSMLELMMSGFESVYARFDHVDQEFVEVKTRVGHLENSMEGVQYSLVALTKAEEKDAKATINHEERLQRLEKIFKIKAVSPAHLIDIQV